MSQAGKVILTAASMGGVDTLTGNTGGAVSPDGGGNINIVMPSPYGTAYGQGEVVGNASPSTLNINPYIVAIVQTVDATPDVTLWSLPISASSAVTFHAIINCAKNDYSSGLTAYASGGVLRQAVGAPAEIGTSSITQDATGGFTGVVNVILNGNSLEIVVTGIAATTLNWKALIYFVSQ